MKLKASVRMRQNGNLQIGKKRKISTSDRGLASKIYKELKKLDTDNPNTLIKEWGTGLIREALTEMLNILIHQENANQSDERLWFETAA